jgi:hypothetical protein
MVFILKTLECVEAPTKQNLILHFVINQFQMKVDEIKEHLQKIRGFIGKANQFQVNHVQMKFLSVTLGTFVLVLVVLIKKKGRS